MLKILCEINQGINFTQYLIESSFEVYKNRGKI